jgi:LysR family transcriptional regulator, cyn operon transcriptional activator
MRLRPGIKYRQLQYFLAAAETLHFSKAAESLFVTQPTLSHQLGELEAQLGVLLFERQGKAVRLTQAGEIFRDHARRSMEEIEAGLNALAELDGLQRGELRIGINQTFVTRLAPPILGEFLNQYPRIMLHVSDLTTRQIERELAEGQLDLGLAIVATATEEIEVEPILQESLVLVVKAGHALARHTSVSFGDLQGTALVLLKRDYATRQVIDSYFEQAGVEPLIACETNTIDLMRGMVSTSGLATIMPQTSVNGFGGLCTVPLVDPVPVRTSALLWPRHRPRSLAARTFAQLVRDHFAALSESEGKAGLTAGTGASAD